MIDVDVFPSDTSWLSEPTTGVHQFGGGSVSPSGSGTFPTEQLEVNMKMVKSLILDSAAGLFAMSGAQAADLSVKAKTGEYVRICSLYCAGFYYMPGTHTCIKVGGFFRADTNSGPGDDSFLHNAPNRNHG